MGQITIDIIGKNFCNNALPRRDLVFSDFICMVRERLKVDNRTLELEHQKIEFKLERCIIDEHVVHQAKM